MLFANGKLVGALNKPGRIAKSSETRPPRTQPTGPATATVAAMPSARP